MFGDKWRQGDWAMRDVEGYWYVVGRSDDTLNISGQADRSGRDRRALMSTGQISEAAVIGVPDEIKGTALCCVCVPMRASTIRTPCAVNYQRGYDRPRKGLSA